MAFLIARLQTVLCRHPFARFLLIGGVNTVFGIGMFWLALAILPTTFAALLVSSVIGILFNFVTTGSYVFQSRDPRLLMAFFGVYVVVFAYNVTGLGLLECLSIGSESRRPAASARLPSRSSMVSTAATSFATPSVEIDPLFLDDEREAPRIVQQQTNVFADHARAPGAGSRRGRRSRSTPAPRRRAGCTRTEACRSDRPVRTGN